MIAAAAHRNYGYDVVAHTHYLKIHYSFARVRALEAAFRRAEHSFRINSRTEAAPLHGVPLSQLGFAADWSPDVSRRRGVKRRRPT